MIVAGGFEKSNFSQRDFEQFYSLNLGMLVAKEVKLNNFEDLKPVNGHLKEILERRTFGLEDQIKDSEALQKAQNMLEENKESDILFKVQGKQIQAHKNILSLRSSFFSNMFSSNSN